MGGLNRFADACAGVVTAMAAVIALSVSSAHADEKLPVWELENTQGRILLMGSVHFLRPQDYPLPDGLFAAYEVADSIVMEIDMDDLDPITAQGQMSALGQIQGGETLDDWISASAYETASEKITMMGLQLEMFSQFEPWFAALTISQMQLLQLGFDPSWGIETQLLQRAAKDGKEITGLETLAEQLGFLDRLDRKTQEQFLLQSLEETDKIQTQLDAMTEAWRNGDAQAMATLFLEEMRSAPKLYDAMLVQRNRSWIDAIEDLANKDENTLVVVGSLHLVGEDSVIEMLEEEGYTARQLSNADFH